MPDRTQRRVDERVLTYQIAHLLPYDDGGLGMTTEPQQDRAEVCRSRCASGVPRACCQDGCLVAGYLEAQALSCDKRNRVN